MQRHSWSPEVDPDYPDEQTNITITEMPTTNIQIAMDIHTWIHFNSRIHFKGLTDV